MRFRTIPSATPSFAGILRETYRHAALGCSDEPATNPKKGVKDDLSRRDFVEATRVAAAVAAIGLSFESVDSAGERTWGAVDIELNDS